MNISGSTTSGSPAWKNLNPERGFDLIRAYLGIGLSIRGVLFLADPSTMGEMVQQGPQVLPLLIALGHIVGGLLLAVGLYTRATATAQAIPVLGALLLVHSQGKLASSDQSFEFTALVLAILVFYACFGAGPWSLDSRRKQA